MPKKKYIVLARNKKISDAGLELDGQHMSFERGKGSALWVADEGKAKALQQKYRKDVSVTLDQQYTWHSNNDNGNGTRTDNIHHYTFQGIALRPQKTKVIGGVLYVWKFGKWRKADQDATRKTA